MTSQLGYNELHYLTNYRQTENEIWSINGKSQEKYFS